MPPVEPQISVLEIAGAVVILILLVILVAVLVVF